MHALVSVRDLGRAKRKAGLLILPLHFLHALFADALSLEKEADEDTTSKYSSQIR